MPSEQSFNPDEAAHKYLSAFVERKQRVEAQIGLQTICVFGNHAEHLPNIRAIVTKLTEENYSAVFLKGLPTPADLNLPTYEKEKIALQKADVIVMIDDHSGSGTATECTYLMENPALADKTILLVPEAVTDDEFYSPELHYSYFPRKTRFNNSDLVSLAVKMAKQATHMLARRRVPMRV